MESIELSLIDLVGVALGTPSRGRRIQNLARLCLSLSPVPGRTRTDLLRFLRLYLPWGFRRATTGRGSGGESSARSVPSERATCGAGGHFPEPRPEWSRDGWNAIRPNSPAWNRLALWATLLVCCRRELFDALRTPTQPLVPTRHQVRTGGFILFSNFPLQDEPPVVRCCWHSSETWQQHLDFSPSEDDDPVEIYILDDKNSFIHFLKFHFPSCRRDAPSSWPRETRGSSTLTRAREARGRLETRGDPRPAPGRLRRPAALAGRGARRILRVGSDPPGVLGERIAPMSNRLGGRLAPELARLESLSDIREMTPRDYRESWAWVHLLLNRSEPGRSVPAHCARGLESEPGPLDLRRRAADERTVAGAFTRAANSGTRVSRRPRTGTPCACKQKNR